MTTRLIQVLTFTNVAAGGQVSLPHDINLNGLAVKPDIIQRDNGNFAIVNVTATQVTVRNDDIDAQTLNLWLERKHSIERAIGPIQNLSPQPFIPASGGTAGMSTDELAYWQTQAALLDPLAYVLNSTSIGGLDATVPVGEVWYATNAFAIYYNDPTYFTQNPNPGLERAGFLRPLDSRRSMVIPSGTRVRSITGINTAYLYYCNPSLVIGADARYVADPKGLYYERLRRLGGLTVRELVCEASGGGSINDDVHVDIPNDFANGMLIGVSAYDCCWLTWGLLNVMNEINNTHINRRAESLLQPFQRLGIGGTTMTLKKGTLSDGWSLNPYGDPYSSLDPATAYPFNGTANALYMVLPNDW